MQTKLVLPLLLPIALLKTPALYTSLLLQLAFALCKETLLLLKAIAVLRFALPLQSLLLALPVRIVALPRAAQTIRLLAWLILSLLCFEPAALIVRLPLLLVTPATLPL